MKTLTIALATTAVLIGMGYFAYAQTAEVTDKEWQTFRQNLNGSGAQQALVAWLQTKDAALQREAVDAVNYRPSRVRATLERMGTLADELPASVVNRATLRDAVETAVTALPAPALEPAEIEVER